MTVAEAKAAIEAGARFGDVFPRMASEGEGRYLKEWFTKQHRWQPSAAAMKMMPPSGNPCKKCGCELVRGGKCLYCPMGCGSEGECS